ncbi:MAG TPA: tyrosine-type recombinase/integrase [Streptosporangiaceae bacterium]|jgi:integrase/recombinase XerC
MTDAPGPALAVASDPGDAIAAAAHAPGDPGDAVAIAESVATLPALPVADTGRYGVRALTHLWLRRRRSANTRRAYFRDLGLWLAYCDRHGLDPLRARRADIDDWVDTSGDAPRTANRRLSAVSSWYRYLAANDAVGGNPVALVDRADTGREESATPSLTAAQVVAVLDHATERADRLGSEPALRSAAILRILFTTGVRSGAVLYARFPDLGVNAGHRVLAYRNKGGHTRQAVLVPYAAEMLDRYTAVRATRAAVAPGELTGPVFVTCPHMRYPGDRPLTSRDLANLVRFHARGAGVPDAARLVPHSTRHTVATLALAAGRTLTEVQDLLGHADPRTTRLYDAARHRLDDSPAYTMAGLLSRTPPV